MDELSRKGAEGKGTNLVSFSATHRTQRRRTETPPLAGDGDSGGGCVGSPVSQTSGVLSFGIPETPEPSAPVFA